MKWLTKLFTKTKNEEPYMLQPYVIWSASKLSLSANTDSSLEDLIHFENATFENAISGGNLSSVIVTHDIEHLITAIYNETDVDLKYATLTEYNNKEKELGYS